jgi:hypothetical protein
MPRELQPRAEINKEIVEQYAKAMIMGSRFPPVIVFQTTSISCTFHRDYYLSDGYHRMAAREIVIDEHYRGQRWKFDGFIARIYTYGIGKDPALNGDPNFRPNENTDPALNADYHDAILYTAQANWDNEDFPRTSYDKRRQIYLMLNNFPDWKDSQISKHCHIDFRFVEQVAEKWRAKEARWKMKQNMPVAL